jgi:hypothetical protein
LPHAGHAGEARKAADGSRGLRANRQTCAQSPNERKRELFERLAADLREIARDIERVIAARNNDGEISS